MDESVTEKILSRAKGSKWTIGSIVSSPEVQGYRTSRETLKAEREAVSLFEAVTDVPHQLSCLFIIHESIVNCPAHAKQGRGLNTAGAPHNFDWLIALFLLS